MNSPLLLSFAALTGALWFGSVSPQPATPADKVSLPPDQAMIKRGEYLVVR